MATSPCALITMTHLSKPHSATSKTSSSTPCFQKLPSFHNETRNLISVNLTGCCKIPVLGRTCWNCRKSFNFSAMSSSSGNWVEVEIDRIPNGYQNEDELIVVNFYRFVFVENPREEVSKHLAFMQLELCMVCAMSDRYFQCVILRFKLSSLKGLYLIEFKGRDIHGRIYLNEQGINAQYSGLSKDALAYVEWVREDDRFSDILVQISPAINGHAFPKLKLRYKPSLVQASEILITSL
ncbi:rhodanese/Cell cycle control phosphatasesuperfamily protein [Striga asiatica]|uniref:Rhodanese/Cell cycle control phosphatasesuperfamily protein n=1 Tax=Striga asiatica TaxID=4170 RepID=A0A5A7P1F5_STRAF|nr:rhodanese/Cell cycle control phosphatasesuperfamily protein [Striga asiatica]